MVASHGGEMEPPLKALHLNIRFREYKAGGVVIFMPCLWVANWSSGGALLEAEC